MIFRVFIGVSFFLHGCHSEIFRWRRGRERASLRGVLTYFVREGKNSVHGIALAREYAGAGFFSYLARIGFDTAEAALQTFANLANPQSFVHGFGPRHGISLPASAWRTVSDA